MVIKSISLPRSDQSKTWVMVTEAFQMPRLQLHSEVLTLLKSLKKSPSGKKSEFRQKTFTVTSLSPRHNKINIFQRMKLISPQGFSDQPFVLLEFHYLNKVLTLTTFICLPSASVSCSSDTMFCGFFSRHEINNIK